MPSDEKRRDVARALRNNLKYMLRKERWYGKDLEYKECGNTAYRNIAASVEDCGNLIDGNYIHVVELVADLIDRPTCHDTEELVDSFTCSSCGFREGKITFNPFTYSFQTIKPGWKYCPNCGAEVVSNG